MGLESLANTILLFALHGVEDVNYLYIQKEKSCLAYQGCSILLEAISMKAELVLEGNWEGNLHSRKQACQRLAFH